MRVVVVGCGIVGAAIAYELSQIAALTVTVLDHQQPAQASTGAALGVLMGAISQKAKGKNLQMRLVGIQQYNRWVPTIEKLTGRKILFNQQGILRLCFEGEDLQVWRSLSTIRQQQGWTLEVCDRDFLANQYPYLNLEGVIGVVYSPQDRQIDPTAMTLGLVEAAKQQGAVFHFGTQVIDAHPKEQTLALQTTQGAIETDWLIIAAGLGSPALAEKLQYAVDIRPVLGQALQVKLPRPLSNSDLQPAITGNDVHLVPLRGNEYWIGATVEFADEAAANALTLQPAAARLETLMQQAIAMCPAFKDATIERQWFGLRPRPFGRPAPIIERLPNHPRVILASGHYRNGVLLAPATAAQVREIVLGR